MNKSQQTNVQINIGNRYLTPEGIGNNGLLFGDCLAELIANSFDWNINKIKPKEKVVINIHFTKDYIKIFDNGVGMNFEQLDLAIDLAKADNSLRERLNQDERKGRYGMGLKIACLSLGWRFVINTISINSPNIKYSFEYDANLALTDNDYLKSKLNIQTVESKNSQDIQGFSHGTEIIIYKLEKDVPIFAANLTEEIQERFFPDIKQLLDLDLLDITIRKDDLEPQKITKRDISSKFEDEVFECNFEALKPWNKKEGYTYLDKQNNSFELKGFIQLLKNRSVAEQKFGLNLYYQGQLIERYHTKYLKDKIGKRNAERIYGELHLDGCTPDPSKKYFKDDEIFKSIFELINDDLLVYKDFTLATNQANSNIAKEKLKRRGIDAGHGEGQATGEIVGEPTGEGNETPGETISLPNPDPQKKNKINLKKPKISFIVEKSKVINESLEGRVNWEYAINNTDIKNEFSLSIYYNPECPLFNEIKKNTTSSKEKESLIEFYKKIAICECIFYYLVNELNHDFEESREQIDNEIYPQVLKLEI
jgi:hypothetical protein